MYPVHHSPYDQFFNFLSQEAHKGIPEFVEYAKAKAGDV